MVLIGPWESGSAPVHPAAMAELFGRIGTQLAEHADTPAALHALTELAVELVPGARWVSVTRGLSEKFVTLAASGQVALDADRLQYQLGTGPCVDAVISEATFQSNDLALDERWSQFGPQAARDFGTRSVLSLRLTMDGRPEDINAALNIYGDHVDAFDDSALVLATLLATHAALALARVAGKDTVVQLRGAVESNREIGVAMGVLMTSLRVTREQALDLLRVASQSTNRKVRDIATEVADTGVLPLAPARPGRPPSARTVTPGG